MGDLLETAIDGRSLAEPLIVSIDLSEIAFTAGRGSNHPDRATATHPVGRDG